jgi:serine protease Do
MTRTAAGLFAASALLAGLTFGFHAHDWLTSGQLRAAALDPEAAGKVYDELRARNTLQEANVLLAKIARVASPSVVHILSERRVPRRGLVEETGSGVLMNSATTPGMYVVTNGHVVADAQLDNITVHLHDGRSLQPKQVWADKATDVAVLKVEGEGLLPSRWGDSDALDIGHMVMAVGSPFGLSQSVTLGIISAKGRRSLELGDGSGVLNKDFLQTDAAINPGNSGGPLIDLRGNVIGINTAIASNSGGNEGIGFSIPSNLARSVMEQLVSAGKVTRAYLGVKLDPNFDPSAAKRLKLDRVRGARVTGVEENSPASKANFLADDVVLSFNGVDVQDENHLINLVSLTPIVKDQRIKVSIWRNGKLATLEIELVEKAAKNQQSSLPDRPGMGTRFGDLGLTLHSLDVELAAQLGFRGPAKGLLVLDVDRQGPLVGQVELYDVVEEVGRTPVRSVEELETLFERNTLKNQVALKVTRVRKGQAESRVVVVDRP